jgi:uncharacterized protein GlcG (DUF336 family)
MSTSSFSVAQAVISADSAARVVAAAVAHAGRLGVRVNAAVVDAGGTLAAFLRMPGAPLHSVDIAIDKAYTAASFGLPTGRWHEELQRHSAAVRDGLVRRPRFVGFGGGLPIVERGALIGAVGISGASEEQDDAIADAARAALNLE